jgi:hypothetical protein
MATFLLLLTFGAFNTAKADLATGAECGDSASAVVSISTTVAVDWLYLSSELGPTQTSPTPLPSAWT